MSRFKLVNLIDKVFVTIAVFLIVYAWINFYIRSLITTFVLSLVFTFAIIYLIYFFVDKKQTQKSITKKRAEEINKNFFAFKMLSKQEKSKLLKSILEKNYPTKLIANKLTYVKDGKTHLVLISCGLDNANQNDIFNLLSENFQKNINEIDIICQNFLEINTKIYKNVKINLINKQQLYDNFFFKYGIFPDDSALENNINKLSFKAIIKNMFLPHKAKSYFFCGIILIFSSIILPYHFYYLIFGSMFMLFAIICKLPIFNKN